MPRVEKNVYELHFRIGLADEKRFRELSDRSKMKLATLARDASLMLLSIAELAPPDLGPRALAAWLEQACARAVAASASPSLHVHQQPSPRRAGSSRPRS